MTSFSLIIYKTPYPWFSLHNFCVSTFLILVAWGQVSLIGWQFVMLRRCLIISLGLLWFVAVSKISSICLNKVSPVQYKCYVTQYMQERCLWLLVHSHISSEGLATCLWAHRMPPQWTFLPCLACNYSTALMGSTQHKYKVSSTGSKWEGRITQN